MDIAQRARSLPIIFSTLVIGLSPLIPVPLLDDLITASLCRWRVKSFAARHGLTLKDEEIKLLAEEQQIGCLGAFAQRTFGYVFREIWENLVPFWEAGRAANLLSRSYYYGVLLDYAFAEGLYKAGNLAEAARLRSNIYEVRKGANLKQMRRLYGTSGRGIWKLAGHFMTDITQRYFRNIFKAFRRWRPFSRQKEKLSEQADQAAENLNEAAGTWVERYRLLFEEFYKSIATIPDKHLEDLCLTLQVYTFIEGFHKIKWLEPWYFSLSRLEQELGQEVSSGHPLWQVRALAIGRRKDADDVLFLLPDHRPPLAVVHLTGQPEKSSEYPHTAFYASLQDFVERQLKPDHTEYKASGGK